MQNGKDQLYLQGLENKKCKAKKMQFENLKMFKIVYWLMLEHFFVFSSIAPMTFRRRSVLN